MSRLTDRLIDELQALLDAVPAPLEPLDVCMLDGFLCGVLVQPMKLPPQRWLQHVTDADGRALPRGFNAARLHALVQLRWEELDDAIGRRQWFDPWVFELRDVETPGNGLQVAGAAEQEPPGADRLPPDADAVYPWVAGFAAALELFPQLMAGESAALTAALALLYRHLDPDDLEDADALIEEIESLEPAADLSEAVEGLVRATLLLADIGRPQAHTAAPPPRSPRRPGGARGGRRGGGERR